MKFSAFKEDLEVGIKDAVSIANKYNMLITSHVLLSAKNGMLEVRGTDLEITGVYRIPAEITAEGEIGLPSKAFKDVVKAFAKKAQVHFEKLNGKDLALKMKTDKGTFKLPGLASDSFPNKPEMSEKDRVFKISPQILRTHFESVAFACSTDDLRPWLMAVQLVIDGKEVKTVATNGHQLVVKKSYLSEPVAKEKIEVLIPKYALTKIIGRLVGKEPITVTISENQIRFSFDGGEIYARLIQDQFVQYKQVIPASYKHEITIDRDALYNTVKRLGVFTDNVNRLIALTFVSGKVRIEVVDSDNGNEGVETIVCDYSNDNQYKIGFNANYLKEMLHRVESDKVIFKLNEPDKAVVLSQIGADAGSYLLLIMPMRIEEQQTD